MNTAFILGIAVGGLLIPCLVILGLFLWLVLSKRTP